MPRGRPWLSPAPREAVPAAGGALPSLPLPLPPLPPRPSASCRRGRGLRVARAFQPEERRRAAGNGPQPLGPARGSSGGGDAGRRRGLLRGCPQRRRPPSAPPAACPSAAVPAGLSGGPCPAGDARPGGAWLAGERPCREASPRAGGRPGRRGFGVCGGRSAWPARLAGERGGGHGRGASVTLGRVVSFLPCVCFLVCWFQRFKAFCCVRALDFFFFIPPPPR